jgi:hypothetical protein
MANLNDLSNEQREEHYQKVCAAIGLDPALRLLDFIWMNQENGLKNLVLYARRGAAEILRAQRGISITKTEKSNGDGEVTFIVEGRDKTGRTEFAVGTAFTKGLGGEKLAHSVMTAHTRATRRLTLQFVGQGLLDETEVNSQTADISSSPGSLAQLAGTSVVMPPPQVTPSAAPGKDITEKPILMPNTIAVVHTPTPEVPLAQYHAPTPKDMGEQITKVYAEGAKFLADMKPAETQTKKESPEPQLEPAQTVVRNSLPATEPDIKADIPLRKKRGRKPRNSVDISSPSQQTEMPVAHIDASGNLTSVSPSADIPKSQPLTTFVPTDKATQDQIKHVMLAVGTQEQKESVIASFMVPSTTPAQYSVSQNPPNEGVSSKSISAPSKEASVPTLSIEKQKEYRERLSKYSQDILPKAGMMPSDGIGGVTMKLRRFAIVHLGLSGSNACFSEEQWQDLFEFLDGYTTKNGAASLVQYIDKAIGATK